MARFRRGTLFLNRYVLLEPIGQGSVSVVYRAEDTLNNRHVAIKLLEPSLADNRRAQERLRRPAEIMSLLADAGVPRVFEYGSAPLGDGAELGYCVMELLTGEALDSRLARGPLSWLDAARVAATIADVLTLAHAQSIALRVVNAAGVLLTADGAKIVDFEAAMVVVPPPPVSPPAAGSRSRRRRGADTGPSAAPRPDRGAVAIANLAAEDVYALGCLLDQTLGGTGPGTGLPAPLVELLLRCLSDPAHRPDAATLSMELWGMLTPGPAATMPPPPDGPLSAPMSQNPAPGRHSVAVAALESRAVAESRVADPLAESHLAESHLAESYAESHLAESFVESRAAAESAAQARGALARAALDRTRHDRPVEQIAYRTATDLPLLGGRTAARAAFATAGSDGVSGSDSYAPGSYARSDTFAGSDSYAGPDGYAGSDSHAGSDGYAGSDTFAGPDIFAGYGTGAVGSAPAGGIPVPHDRDRALGPQQVPAGRSGQGGRHRRRRPAWTAPTGQANALS